MDRVQGIIQGPPNLPRRAVPIKALLEAAFNLPCWLENDAN
jgi:predicted NBD/HSP70 family sugar kinase